MSWIYDKQGRVTSQTDTIPGASALTTSWTYDAMGRARTMTYPDNEQVTTTYDVQGPMTLGTYVLGADYWASGQLKTLNLASGVSTSYTYNLQNRRLTNLKTGNLQDLAYEYDAVGNITKVTDAIRVETSNYEYDDLDRLKKAYITGVYTQEWTHSPIGNITWRKDNGVQTNYTYNPTTRPHAVTQVGSTSYGYDNNGNMTSRTGGTLSYDYENRLTQVISGTVTTNYVYNGDGARVKKVVGSTATYYVGNWYEVTNGAVTKYYYFGSQRVVMKQGSTVTYLHGDHLGSTSVASDASGVRVSRQTYFAFGAVRTTEGTLPTDYTFTGQKNDASSALMFYNARYYDAASGRFVQPDSIVPNYFIPQTMNRYAYARNNPLKYIDPTGHDVIIITGFKTDNDYNDPSSWEKWISAYASEAKYAEWYDKWAGKATEPNEYGVSYLSNPTDSERMALAKETGIAVFDWSRAGGTIKGSTTDAAMALQEFINQAGLQDVTIVAHSKGAMAATELLAMYQNGTVQKGTVKNVVLIDAPEILLPNAKTIDANKTGVKVVSVLGWASCWPGEPCSKSAIENDDDSFTMPGHDAGKVSPRPIYDRLGICGDAHASCAQ